MKKGNAKEFRDPGSYGSLRGEERSGITSRGRSGTEPRSLDVAPWRLCPEQGAGGSGPRRRQFWGEAGRRGWRGSDLPATST